MRVCARIKLRTYQRHITFYPDDIHYVITNGNQYKTGGFMKYPVAWAWYAKWVIIYLVILPLLIWRFENIQLFQSHIAFLVVTGFTMGLAVRLIDRLFYFLVQHAGKKY
ncbi:hypothetical protein AXA91_16690 [Salmonella enterica]|nr:hypothetical protein [Salmonella enterica]